MVESLRGLGYNTATALADIIDNSIAADAKLVDIKFEWNETRSWISILDNGRGMDAAELDSAMRLGELNPLEVRDKTDLGRFGLGLKTASFSQARRLTVASRSLDSDVECLRWDLDLLANPDDEGWHLYEGADPSSRDLLDPILQIRSGTLVLWENLDRIVTDGFMGPDLLNLMDRVEHHLAMTFHRFLEGAKPKLLLRLNGKRVSPWDPFMEGHPGKPWAPEEVELERGSGVLVQCHVLPHKDQLTDPEFQTAAGPEGWTSQQGFYIYRNERLLLGGGWLGLGPGRPWTRDESHRLARIRIDIPNTRDDEWKLDIRKSTARPPIRLRPKLARLAEETRSRARRVFAHRGQITAAVRADNVEPAWVSVRSATGQRYRISRDHEAVRAALEMGGDVKCEIEAMLRVIEETVPVQRIWLDTAEERETPRTGFAGEPNSEVSAVLLVMYRTLRIRNGLSAASARERLLRTEPFNLHPALVAALPDKLDPEGK
jgi:hypothetical protein